VNESCLPNTERGRRRERERERAGEREREKGERRVGRLLAVNDGFRIES